MQRAHPKKFNPAKINVRFAVNVILLNINEKFNIQEFKSHTKNVLKRPNQFPFKYYFESLINSLKEIKQIN